MELKEIKKIVQSKFQTEVDISNFDCSVLSFNTILKVEFENQYVVIRENSRDNQLEIAFFKSDQKGDKLFDDYIDLGICFCPKSIEHVKIIIDSLDA